jgi:hypothetical protein
LHRYFKPWKVSYLLRVREVELDEFSFEAIVDELQRAAADGEGEGDG